jgi:iron complex outermembrane receptor protein
MEMKKTLSTLAAALAAIPAFADDTRTLPAIEINASGAEIPALTVPTVDAKAAELRQIAGGANVIDAESYKTGRASTLSDALGFSPGVYVQSRYGSEEARLSIRGSGIQRTFHLRGIQVMQDGVPINQADGGGDFQSIEPLAARYIEVYRGANALQYGSSTLGGAVNFVTPTGYDAPGVQARAELGSFDYARLQGSLAGVSGALDYFLSVSHFSQEGFRDHAEQDNNRLFGNVGYRISPDLETRFYFSVVDTDSELPGSLTQAQLKENPRQNDLRNANSNVVVKDNKRDFKLYRLSNKTTWSEGDTRVDASAFVAKKTLFHPLNFAVIDQDNLDYGVDVRATHGAKDGNRLTLGVTLHRNETGDERYNNSFGRRAGLTDRNQQTVNTATLFGEYLARVAPQWSVVAGAQAIRTTRVQDDDFAATTPSADRDKTYTGFNPKLGFLYDYAPQWQFFGNVARSFEAPSFSELTGGATNNPVFADAQRATTLELGTRGTRGVWEWDVALYHARVQDELLSLYDAVSNTTTTINAADDTIHQGIEAGWVGRAGEFVWRNSYQLNDFRFDGDAQLGDNEMGGIPRHFYRTELLYTQGDFFVGPTVEAASDWYVDHANTLKADSYATLGFKFGSRGKHGFSWYVEGRNLTDETYAATTGVLFNASRNATDTANVDPATQAQFLPGDGRAFYVGVEWRD